MVIAFIVLLAVVVGGVVLFRNGTFNNKAAQPDTNINVTIPTPTGGGGGGAGGGTTN